MATGKLYKKQPEGIETIQLSKEMESEFPKMEKSLSRLIKFLEIMKDNNLIYWKGEEKK